MNVIRDIVIEFTDEEIEIIKDFQEIFDEIVSVVIENKPDEYFSTKTIFEDICDFANQNINDICGIKAIK